MKKNIYYTIAEINKLDKLWLGICDDELPLLFRKRKQAKEWLNLNESLKWKYKVKKIIINFF